MRILLFAVALALCACKTDAPAETSSPAPGATPESVAAPAEPSLPALPMERLRRLADSVTYIDYVFYAQNFSMSMDEPPAIAYALGGISLDAPASGFGECPALGRIFYKIGGRTVEEAALHFSRGCAYLAFVGADKTPAYANALSDQGKAFFNNQFGQLVPNFQAVE